MSTGTSSSIAKKTAETYSSHIASAFEDTRKVLENMCCLTGKKDLFDSLCVLVDTKIPPERMNMEGQLVCAMNYPYVYG